MAGGGYSFDVFESLLLEPGASTHTFDASSETYEYLNEDIRKYERFDGGGHHTEERYYCQDRVWQGHPYIYGPLEKYISPGELETLLVHMWGSTTTPTREIPYFGLMIDRDEGVFQYNDCKITRWILRGRASDFVEQGDVDLMRLRLDILASEEVGPNDSSPPSWPGTPPTTGKTEAYVPFHFAQSDSAVTIDGATREITEFVLMCDHKVYPRTVNALIPQSMSSRDRLVRARVRVPWSSTYSGLYKTDVSGTVATLIFTNGTVSTKIRLERFQIPRQTPVRRGEDRDLILDGLVTHATTDNKEMSFTNDATV